MPPRIAKNEYRGYACHQCHRQKVKCSRERPCRNCALANRPCTYAVRDRKVTVPESYLRNLEGGVHNPRAIDSTANRSLLDSNTASEQRMTGNAGLVGPRLSYDSVVENSTAELFVSKLKQIQGSNSSPGVLGTCSDSLSPQTGYPEQSFTKPSKYEYFALSYDTSHTQCTFKLPPYPYAIFLLDQFALYLGQDWHWFRLRFFHKRLENTYMTTNSAESKDRTWLCQLLVVLALAESVNPVRQPEIRLDLNDHTSQHPGDDIVPATVPPPGSEFFEQALRLLNIPFENASVDHIVILNMIVLYSNQLNRQKTAYMYAGESARLCNMLQLHQASASLDCSSVEREHRKRVWWSTYCLDRMTSTQRGLLPAFQVDQTDLDYPSQAELSLEDVEEFADADYLTARIQLTIIEANNAKTMGHFGRDDAHDIETICRPMLRRLGAWKAGLPAHMALEMENGIPQASRSMACTRSLANFYLRYNQCLILLLRPLFLKQIALILSNEESNASEEDLKELNNTCLRSARSNLLISLDLRSYGLLVSHGFMENMHIFTSLMILYLAMSINSRRPGSFHQKPNDANTYEEGKNTLRHMMRSGSLAAKGHLNMLKEVEDLGKVIAMDGGVGANCVVEQWDVDEWMTQLFENGNMSNVFQW